jgi:hypothetical protein
MVASRALSHSLLTGASGFTKSGPTMVHPLISSVVAIKLLTDNLNAYFITSFLDSLSKNINNISITS